MSAETPSRVGAGGQRRQWHQLRVLVEAGVEVHVLALAGEQDDASARALAPVERFAGGRVQRHLQIDLAARLLRLRPDAAVVAHLETVPLAGRALRAVRVPWLLDVQNVYSRWHAGRGADDEAAAWAGREAAALAAADLALVCSEEERAALLAVAPRSSVTVTVAANGVHPAEWPSASVPGEGGRTSEVAFFGAWSHAPNRSGLVWFLSAVWPSVLAGWPAARLVLYGPGSPPPVWSAAPGVSVAGRVDDLASALGRAGVIVVPLVEGMGSRLKLAEALASGTAVVSTPVGVEGFPGADGVLDVASGADAFSAAVVRRLADSAGAVALGAAGRALALSSLSWEATTAPMVAWVAGRGLGPGTGRGPGRDGRRRAPAFSE